MTTLRREMIGKIFERLELAYQDNPPTEEATKYNRAQAETIADTLIELRAFKTDEERPEYKTKKLPAGSDIGFALAAGMSSEDIAAQNEADAKERDLLNWYESKMGYTRPLDWWTDDKLKDLREFLVTQTKEDIETFAKWTRRDFSKFGPENAKRYPNDVITFWGLAFPDKPSNLQSEVTDDAHGSPMSW